MGLIGFIGFRAYGDYRVYVREGLAERMMSAFAPAIAMDFQRKSLQTEL